MPALTICVPRFCQGFGYRIIRDFEVLLLGELRLGEADSLLSCGSLIARLKDHAWDGA